MKKSIIAAGAASVALAAMPVVGVFAETTTSGGIVKDEVSVTVSDTCSITSTGTLASNTITRSVSFGTVTTSGANPEKQAEAMIIDCNKGWALTAKAAGSPAGHEKDLVSSGNYIYGDPTGDGVSGTVSNWKFKLTGTDITTTTTNYTNYQVIPDNTTGVAVAGNASGADSVSITPSYQLDLIGSQAAGIYEGAISYTLTANS